MTRRYGVLPLVLALAGISGSGCGGGGGLTALGFARFDDVAFDLHPEFNFAQPMRLDDPSAAVTGTCQITRLRPLVSGGPYTHSVLVDLTSNASDRGSMTFIARDDEGEAPSSAEVRVLGATYRSAALCAIDLTYADDGGSATIDVSECQAATGDGREGVLDAHLELHGCSVVVADE